MGRVAAGVTIGRSQQDVFDFLSNPANLPGWSPAFESAEWTSADAPGAGSTYRVSARLLRSRKHGLFEITQWDRPRLFSYRMNTRAFPIERIETTIALQPADDGTRVSFDSQFELVRMLRFAEGLFARFGEKQDGRNLDVAKRILEAG
jgi:uncharacterized protein YndB with AHSA1/START domain